MRGHPSRADVWLSEECERQGVMVSARVIQSMKERGALRRPESKVASYPRGSWKTVEALIRNGWRHKAQPATFRTFLEGHPFTAKGIRWSFGTPHPSAVTPPADSTEDQVEAARDEAVQTLAEEAMRSRNPEQAGVRKMLRTQGIDPRVAAYDMAMMLVGDLPVVETEHYEPTTATWEPAEMPWVLRLVGKAGDGWAADPDEEWKTDPGRVADELRDFFLWLSSQGVAGLAHPLSTATEDQRARARDEVNDMLDVMPHLRRDVVGGLAGAFLVALIRFVALDESGPGEELDEEN